MTTLSLAKGAWNRIDHINTLCALEMSRGMLVILFRTYMPNVDASIYIQPIDDAIKLLKESSL